MRRMRHLKPREIQGCQLALDASIPTSLYDATSGGSLVAADGAVARWEDQSGNGRHATQGTALKQSIRRVASVGGCDAVDFDGSDDVLSTANSAMLNNKSYATLFCVYKSDDGTSLRQIARLQQGASPGTTRAGFGEKLSTNGRLFFGARRDDADSQVTVESSATAGTNANAALLALNFGNANMTGYEGGVQTASAAVGAAGATSGTDKRADIGAAGTAFYFNGKVAAFALWHTQFSAAQIRRLSHSAMRKWRING